MKPAWEGFVDFIAIEFDKYDVWDAFIQPVPVREEMYFKNKLQPEYLKFARASSPQDSCEGGIDDTECTVTGTQTQQQFGPAQPSFGNSDPGTGHQDPGSDPGYGIGGDGLSEEQMACAAGQRADRNRNQAADDALEEIEDEISNDGLSGEDQPEYAVSGFFNDDGSVSMTEAEQGQSYAESNPPSTPIPFLTGPEYQVSDFAFIVHSHGHTNNSSIAIEN